MRGCSRGVDRLFSQKSVVPAHAGMFPTATRYGSCDASGPRACGDVPDIVVIAAPRDVWSPRMRGCSPIGAVLWSRSPVVPAHAGMFPPHVLCVLTIVSGPRACGDVPLSHAARRSSIAWSPRMRGCSQRVVVVEGDLLVVPAHAGMFPAPRHPVRRSPCGPRACGDVPIREMQERSYAAWSPRMRGCSRFGGNCRLRR